MKITFDGTIHDIIAEMEKVFALLAVRAIVREGSATHAALPPITGVQGPGPEAPPAPPQIVENPVEKSAAKSAAVPEGGKKPRTAKQLENDEKLRERALAKKAAGTAFKKAVKETGGVMPVIPTPPPPATAESLGLGPAEVVNIRQRTITDLQEAYANGKQQEVFELLSRFGNGAKSFRELPPDAFVPIREAIDNGALT